MNSSRRDLLKYFGVGTIIAPLVGAEPAARLIELPKIEILEARSIPTPLDLSRVKAASLVCEMKDGTLRTVKLSHVAGNGAIPIEGVRVSIDILRDAALSPLTSIRLGSIWADGGVV